MPPFRHYTARLIREDSIRSLSGFSCRISIATFGLRLNAEVGSRCCLIFWSRQAALVSSDLRSYACVELPSFCLVLFFAPSSFISGPKGFKSVVLAYVDGDSQFTANISTLRRILSLVEHVLRRVDVHRAASTVNFFFLLPSDFQTQPMTSIHSWVRSPQQLRLLLLRDASEATNDLLMTLQSTFANAALLSSAYVDLCFFRNDLFALIRSLRIRQPAFRSPNRPNDCLSSISIVSHTLSL